jgi:hypothetical protein
MKLLIAKLLARFTTDEPMIYAAIDGKMVNLRMKDLTRKVDWQFSPDGIALVETYFLGDKLVKRGADVFKLPPGTAFNVQGNLG